MSNDDFSNDDFTTHAAAAMVVLDPDRYAALRATAKSDAEAVTKGNHLLTPTRKDNALRAIRARLHAEIRAWYRANRGELRT